MTRCPYPHRNHEGRTSKANAARRKRNATSTVQAVKRKPDGDEHAEDVNAKRYFIESSDQSHAIARATEASTSSTFDQNDKTIIVVRKPKLGALPSYIPLG